MGTIRNQACDRGTLLFMREGNVALEMRGATFPHFGLRSEMRSSNLEGVIQDFVFLSSMKCSQAEYIVSSEVVDSVTPLGSIRVGSDISFSISGHMFGFRARKSDRSVPETRIRVPFPKRKCGAGGFHMCARTERCAQNHLSVSGVMQ